MKRIVFFGAILLALVVSGTVLLQRMASPAISHGPFWLVLLAFLLSLALTPLAGRLAHRLGAIDKPGGRKIHERPTPLLGGLAVYIAFAVCTVPQSLSNPELRAVFLASSLIFVIGFIEGI